MRQSRSELCLTGGFYRMAVEAPVSGFRDSSLTLGLDGALRVCGRDRGG